MWFLRGAGMKGLGGMAPLHRLSPDQRRRRDALTVIRPLLEVSKAEILEYLKEKATRLSHRPDQSGSGLAA